MSLSQEAERAYGPNFVPKATAVASRLGIPLEWLLAAIYWETTHFKSKGPPWPVNPGDKGGGLIGFTPLKGHPAEFKNPVEQLDFVEQHYRYWMTKLKISRFGSPEDLYLIVRGPYGIGKPDSFNMGGGLNKGQVLKIYRGYLTTVLNARPSPTQPQQQLHAQLSEWPPEEVARWESWQSVDRLTRIQDILDQ